MYRIRITLQGSESREEIQQHIEHLQFLATKARTEAEIDAAIKFKWFGNGEWTAVRKGHETGATGNGLTEAEIEANNRDHELHEASSLKATNEIVDYVKENAPLFHAAIVGDLPPAGTFEPADDTPPFVPAAGASNTSASPAPPAPTNASANELDADGLPWDERIHSSNRKKTGDGKWWAKRGVDDQTRIKVEAELRSVLPPAPPAPPKAPAPPPPPPAAGTNAFQAFVKALNMHNGVHGMIPTPKINEAIAAMGITPANLPAMAIPANQLRLGELALAIGLEFNP